MASVKTIEEEGDLLKGGFLYFWPWQSNGSQTNPHTIKNYKTRKIYKQLLLGFGQKAVKHNGPWDKKKITW